ncbi:MAG: GNAT family N-acetyltransferase [Thermomicrobiales bacterium]
MMHGRLTTLRAIERDDLDHLWRWYNDSAVMYWWGEPYRTMSRDELASRYGSAGLGGASGNAHWLLITTRADDGAGEPIGRIGYVDLDRRNRHAEIAIQIGERAYWGRGYGSDAILAFLGYLFHELNLHKVWLRTETYNTRAQRAYEKCGFQRDGVLREHVFLGGQYHDSVIMSITEDEYRTAHPLEVRMTNDE